ncbi:MAG: SPOR domain-containing protein [Longimicrobiales bacterium]
MNDPRVVLDKTGLIQLSVGMVALLGLGFVAGAVVGYGVHVDPQLRSAADGVSIAMDLQDAPACLPADPVNTQLAAADAPTDEAAPTAESMLSDRATVAMNDALMRRRTLAAAASDLSQTAEMPSAIGLEGARKGYAVQLGAFGVEENADRFAGSLRGRGYDPLVVAARNRSGQWIKRVHLQVFESEASALLAAESFSTHEGIPAVVVPFEGQQ